MTPIEIIAKALRNLDDTPFTARRKIDKSGYEVVRMDNADWREVISDEQTVMSRHKSQELADARCAEYESEWQATQIINALQSQGYVLQKVTPE